MSFHARKHEALLYFPALIIGGMCTLGGLAWAYEKTRKRIDHPRLGKLTYYGDSWVAVIPHYTPEEPAVRVDVPGSRKGPQPDSLERFESLWARMPALIEQVRPRAVEGLEDDHDAMTGTSEEKETRDVIEAVAADPKSFAEHWKLGAVGLRSGLSGRPHWYLEFGVSWDAEHQRAAYFDLDEKLIRYEHSSAVVDL